MRDHPLVFKYGPSLKPGAAREAGRRMAEEIRKILEADTCPATGKLHVLDDGKCLNCDLDLEYTCPKS